MCHGEGVGLDHIREHLLGRLSSLCCSLLLFVVSDLVSDLEVLAVSSNGLTGPFFSQD